MPAKKQPATPPRKTRKVEVRDLAAAATARGGSGSADPLASNQRPPGAGDDPSLMFSLNYGEIKSKGPKP